MGTDRFQNAVNFSPGNRSVAIIKADLNGDGKLIWHGQQLWLRCQQRIRDALSVLLAMAMELFSPAWSTSSRIPICGWGGGGDVNGDGKLEFWWPLELLRQQNVQRRRFAAFDFAGQRRRHFSSADERGLPINYPSGGGPAEINGDGKLDMWLRWRIGDRWSDAGTAGNFPGLSQSRVCRGFAGQTAMARLKRRGV